MVVPYPARLLLLAALGAGGCAPDPEPACSEAEQAVNWENFAAGFFSSYCRTCHSAQTPDRRGAPVGMDFDTEQQAVALRDAVQRRVLEERTMPEGGGVLEADLEALEVWLRCTP